MPPHPFAKIGIAPAAASLEPRRQFVLLWHLFGATANSWHSEWVAAWAQCVSARLPFPQQHVSFSPELLAAPDWLGCHRPQCG